MKRDYLIAGLRVRMDTFGRTERQAEDYLTQTTGDPDIVISNDPETMLQMQPHLTLEECEYLTSGASFYHQLIKFNGMMLHSSAVVMDGYAYLFTAPCGTGKSTHTDLWRKTFGEDQVRILNDDKPALRLEDGQWYAYGTPWSGKTAQNINMRVPLGGICILTRGETNEIAPFGGTRAAMAFMEQTARPDTMEERGSLLELIDKLLTKVPVWKMKCTPTEEAAHVSQRAMYEEARKRFG